MLQAASARALSTRNPKHSPCFPPLQPSRRSTVVVRAAGWDLSAEVPEHLKGKDLAGSERRRHRTPTASHAYIFAAFLQQGLHVSHWCRIGRQLWQQAASNKAPLPLYRLRLCRLCSSPCRLWL